MSEIVQDEFTKRLLIIHLATIRRGEIRFKKNFSDAVKLTSSFFWQIQHCKRNYPPEKREQAIASLLDKYGVNPAYMKGNSEQQFVRDAQPIKRAVREDAVKINFADKNTKRALLDQLAAKDAMIKAQAQRIIELEDLLQEAAEPGIEYRKPDDKSDTTSEKRNDHGSDV